MTAAHLIKSDLAQFTGTTKYFRHWLNQRLTYTEGVNYMVEKTSALWLLDEIAFAQVLPAVRAEEFQLWIFEFTGNGREARLTCEDGNGTSVWSKRISHSDFPLDKIKLYLTSNVLMLPGEY